MDYFCGLSLVLGHVINLNLYLEIDTHNVTFQVVVYCIISVDLSSHNTHSLNFRSPSGWRHFKERVPLFSLHWRGLME